jgi:alcohol dehydrogenase YqhD (iron-dependent ADH family)
MDPWQIEKACKLLESMRESGRTILVVTNQQSVRDRGFFDREIRAVKENHITHFETFDLSSNH